MEELKKTHKSKLNGSTPPKTVSTVPFLRKTPSNSISLKAEASVYRY